MNVKLTVLDIMMDIQEHCSDFSGQHCMIFVLYRSVLRHTITTMTTFRDAPSHPNLRAHKHIQTHKRVHTYVIQMGRAFDFY